MSKKKSSAYISRMILDDGRQGLTLEVDKMDNLKKRFLSEYKILCRKYGLIVDSDDSLYVSVLGPSVRSDKKRDNALDSHVGSVSFEGDISDFIAALELEEDDEQPCEND